MTLKDIMSQLAEMGSESTKKTLLNHGAKEPFFGVKVQDLKLIIKKTKYNQALAEELYDTGISDAMYLAGLMAEPQKISAQTLQKWAEKAHWSMISEYTVPWVASESLHGWQKGLEWIQSDGELMASCGWATLANYISITPNDQLDYSKIKELCQLAADTIHETDDRVAYTKNNFLLSVGAYMPELTNYIRDLALSIGKVKVNMGKTACKVPDINQYLTKMEQMGKLGHKRKEARC